MWFGRKRKSQRYQSAGVLLYCSIHPDVVMFLDASKVALHCPQTPEEQAACYTCGECWRLENAARINRKRLRLEKEITKRVLLDKEPL